MTEKLRSWDRWAGNDQISTTPGKHRIGSSNQVRVVEWPEGAPDRDMVPQAGALVQLRAINLNSGAVRGRVYTVVNGIPEEREGGFWRLRVVAQDDKFKEAFPLLNIVVPYVPEPEVEATYTEAEIRAAYDLRIGDGHALFVREVIDNLRSAQ